MKTTIIYLLALLIPSIVYSQVFTNKYAEDIVKQSKTVRIDEKSKKIKFIELKENSLTEPEAKTWLIKSLNLSGNHEFRLVSQESDKLGSVHNRYNLYYKNLLIENDRYYVHSKGIWVTSANGEISKYSEIKVEPTINEELAFNNAVNYTKATQYLWEVKNISKPKGELIILPINDKYVLAYKFDIYAIKPLSRNYVYVDANSGNVVKTKNRIISSDVTGTAVTKYNGTKQITTDSYAGTYRLRETGRGGGIETYDLNNSTSSTSAVDFIDSDNYWNTTTSQDNAAYDAHYSVEMTYDYYYSKFGRNSYDNAGAKIYSYVHCDYSYVNAYWDGQGMYFGDGDGVETTALTSTDIVAHEFTHGVTEYTAGLEYSSESGALNEAYSDIFGATIDFYANPSTANFLMADQIFISGGAFRNMANPNQYQNPDTYLGDFWDYAEEVHCNSGVMNYWYYLLSSGGTGVNDLGNSFSVNGIGLDAAAAIAYRALSVYLTPYSTYSDASYYTILAATDLYGDCSNEVINTTNAWYAVGIGGLYSNAVVANFNPSLTYSCNSPATVSFTNNSINGSSYLWNFGDGTTSTLQNPSHTYTNPGTYSVQLITNGSSLCNNSDTLLSVNLITVTNSGGPITASCTPSTTSPGSMGIYNFSFNTINNSSSGSLEGYKDFTCSNTTTVTEGTPYNLSITTNYSTPENVKVWLDLNNDGQFSETNELFFTSDNNMQHNGNIIIPSGAVFNTPLRLRVTSDIYYNTITNSCYNSYYGQTEDYSVTILQNLNPPVAEFSANNTTTSPGQTVQFSDLSLNIPTSWQWQFPGGTPSSSTLKNPSVVYNSLGTYDVKLKTTNAYGTDSITKLNYMQILTSYNLCSTTSTTSQSGNLYDSGGPTGNYQDNENCSFLIDINCATSITLSFSSFNTDYYSDYLYAFDGPTTSSPQLLSATGTTIPSPVTAYSGKMLVVFYSDSYYNYPGFSATWSSVVPSGNPPVADFSISDFNPPLSASVQFTDITTNNPVSWLWNFGDGNISTIQNPTHSYLTPGNYTITLISNNCFYSDTVTKSITVQQAPGITINPYSFNVTINNCNDSITLPMVITNTGSGTLTIEAQTSLSGNNGNIQNVLIFDDQTSYNYYNQAAVNLGLLPVLSSNFTDFQTKINNGTQWDLIIVSSYGVFFPSSIASQLLTFLSNGGKLIFSAWDFDATNPLFATLGLNSFINSFTTPLNIYPSISQHPVFNNPNHLSQLLWTDDQANIDGQLTTVSSNATQLAYFNGFSNYGAIVLNSSENSIYNAFQAVNFNGDNNSNGKIDIIELIENEIQFFKGGSASDAWLEVTPATDTIAQGNSSQFNVEFNSTGLNSGIYNSTISIITNDPLNPLISIPCTLTVAGSPNILLAQTSINYNNVIQYSTNKDSLLIYNIGCDTLKFNNISANNADIHINTNTLNILPHDSTYLKVTLTPSIIGAFSGIVYLYNNDIDTMFTIIGNVLDAPSISVSPDSLFITFAHCNDSIVETLNIHNSGLGILDVEISDGNFTTGSVTILEDGFESGIDPSIWVNVSGVASSAGCGANSGSYSLYFDYNGIRVAETKNLNIPDAGWVEFYLKMGAGSYPCEQVDAGEEVVLEYSINSGTTWTIINTYYPINYYNFTHVAEQIPQVAITPQTKFRWRQLSNSGSGYDNWSLDDVLITRESTGTFVDSLTVNPGSSVAEPVTFISSNYPPGTSIVNITLNSNDPFNPQVIVPCLIYVPQWPCPDFTSIPSLCSGSVSFYDNSTNNPTFWVWNFGDGATSYQQNPIHTYASNGTYTVSLVACNTAQGCGDTIEKDVTVNTTGIVSASCTPTANSLMSEMGIFNVSFNTISNTTTADLFGYRDYSCDVYTNVFSTQSYLLSVTTGSSYSENVVAWLDYNNNGIFETNEKIMTSLNNYNHSTNVLIPSTAVLNTPLRLRVAADYYSQPIPQSCVNVYYGQFEDYAVIVSQIPLVADFAYTFIDQCYGVVSFADSSTSNPTSWYWDFGDGNTSTIKNPFHIYHLHGLYNVMLIVSNGLQTDTVYQNVAINSVIAHIVTDYDSLYQNVSIPFTSDSYNVSSWWWNFGDGATDVIQSPTHTYNNFGVFTVSLVVENSYGCSDSTAIYINVQKTDVPETNNQGNSILIYPNPNKGNFNVSFSNFGYKDISIELCDILGKTILKEELFKVNNLVKNFNVNNKAETIYFLKIKSDGKEFIDKLVIFH